MKNTTFFKSNFVKNLRQWYIACIVLCLSVTGSFAQGTVPIGSGTATVSTMPISSCYGYSYTQQIVTSAEYSSGGGIAGNITKVRFYYTGGASSFANSGNWTVYIGHTAKTEFTSTSDWEPVANLTQVFSGTIPTPVADEWLELTFTTPFNYNGTSNLIIAVDENQTSWNCTANWGSYTSTANSGIYHRSDGTNADPASPPTASSRTSALPRLQFEGMVATCIPPTSIVAATTGFTTGTVTWTESTTPPANGYEYYYNTSNTPPTASTEELGSVGAGMLTTDLTGLTPNETYYVWVRSVCSDTDSSLWGGPTFFYTGYCSPNPSSVDGDGIVNVTIGTINNTTETETGNYGDFSAMSTDVFAGYTVPFSIGYNTGYTYGTKIWIDWNNDADFTDEGELVYTGLSTNDEPTTLSGSFVVPADAALVGSHRMRIGGTDTDTGGTPCYTGSWASYEDYTINVVLPPVPSITSFTPDSYCAASGDITITGTGLMNGSLTIGGTPVAITTITDTQIVANVPAGVSGAVAVTTVSGTSTTTETFTVTTPAPVTLSDSQATICFGDTTGIVTITEGLAEFDTFVWAPTEGVSGTAAEGFTFNPTETTTYILTASQSAGACVVVVNYTVNVNMLPTAVVAADDFAICQGSVEALSATGGVVELDYSQSLDAFPADFAAGGTGTPSASVNNTYFVEGTGSVNLNAGFSADVAYSMNSDLDLSDFTTAQLTFSHICALEGYTYSYDLGYVEYSADGGETWTTFPSSSYAGAGTLITTQGTATPVEGVIFSTKSYADWIEQFDGSTATPGDGPATALWKTETINIPAEALTNEFRIRLRVNTDSSVSYYGWLVDDLQIYAGYTNVVWSPVTNLYTDAAATVPYAGESMSTVYVKPTGDLTYTATSTNQSSGCDVSDTVNVTMTIVPAPEAPAAQTLCGGSTIADLEVTGEMVHWYYASTGGTEISTTTPVLNGTTYYVSQTVGECESVARTMVMATVNTVDAPTIEEDVVTFCNAATLADIEMDGEGILWYTSATGGDALEADTEIAEGISIFFASQTVDGCESTMRTAVVTELNVTVAPDADEAQTFCNAATVADLMAEGEMIMWYDAEDNILAAETVLTNGGVYYASQTINGCESSEMAMVTVTINAPAAPTGDADQEVCEGSTLADLTLDNEMLTWYDALEGGNMLEADTALTNGGIYYASQWVDGCESIGRYGVTATMITVTVDTPADVTECDSYVLPALTNGAYYTETNGGGETVAAGTEIMQNTTLYVYATGGTEATCSAEHMFTITISPAAAPSGEANQSVEIHVGEEATIADLVVTTEGEGTVTWYASEENAANGTNALSMDTVIIDGSTYYATFTSGDCTSGTFGVTVDVVLGNHGFDRAAFTYHPNPVRNVLNIAYSSEITSVTVFNLLGQQVIAQQPNATEVKVDMSGLADGTYVINVTSGNAVNTFKVVKHNN